MSGVQYGYIKHKLTLAERVALQLAVEIVSGRLPAETRLDEKVQSRRLSVSRTPLREALCHLAALGLAASRPHSGVFVIEGAGLAFLQAVEELIGSCLANHLVKASKEERLKTAALIRTSGDWGARLMGGGHNPILAHLGRTFWAIFQQVAQPERAAAVQESLLRAVEQGDAQQARLSLRAYLSAVTQNFVKERAA